MARAQIAPYTAQQTVTDFGLTFSDLKYSAVLAATTDTPLTIPGNAPRYKAVFVILPGAGIIWVANGTPSPTVPSASADFVETNWELIETFEACREVKSGDVLHFYASEGGPIPISVILYALNTNN